MNNPQKPMYLDYRRTNGGARPGAGRPFSEYKRKMMEEQAAWWLEKVVVKEFRHGQMRRVKKPRIKAFLDEIFWTAIRDRSVKHAKLWLDLVLGPKKTEYQILMGPYMHLKAWVRRDIARELGL